MKVKTLINRLKKFNGEMQVVSIGIGGEIMFIESVYTDIDPGIGENDELGGRTVVMLDPDPKKKKYGFEK